MNISELIQILQDAIEKHGDLVVTGGHVPGTPELTITDASYAPAGPLPKSTASGGQENLPDRFILSWEEMYV